MEIEAFYTTVTVKCWSIFVIKMYGYLDLFNVFIIEEIDVLHAIKLSLSCLSTELIFSCTFLKILSKPPSFVSTITKHLER